ncbi:hypothetical protein BD769DRAFT_1666251 [Suillus cothurnatus]|nr:hypothetical protein BD769DRAFT_1666251 [Suillus cothurnatus]
MVVDSIGEMVKNPIMFIVSVLALDVIGYVNAFRILTDVLPKGIPSCFNADWAPSPVQVL